MYREAVVSSVSDQGKNAENLTDLYVKKRDGKTLVKFDREKITQAINKAFISSNEVTSNHEKIATFVCCKVVAKLTGNRSIDDPFAPFDIEEIQNTVENQLMELGYFLTAKKFIIYRKNRSDARDMAKDKLIEHIEEYFGRAAWDIKENSNMDFSLQGLNNFVTSKVMNMYWMQRVYTPDIREAHITGRLHIHDASLLSVYCCGWDLRDLLLTGFGGVAGTNTSGPAKHFDAVLGQVWNFLYSLQGEAAGAQAFSNFDTYLAPFVYYDNLTYKEVKQNLQKFMHNMTTKTRVGFQCVPDTYQCLTPEGWKYYHELRVGDQIYVADPKTKELKLDTLQRVNTYDYDGEMVRFSGRKIDFLTTPNHRTIRRKFNSDEWVIETSEDIYSKYKTPIDIPLAAKVNRPGVNMTDDEIRLLGWALTDCHMDAHSSRLRIYQSPKKHAHSIAQLLMRLDADWYAAETAGGGYGDEVYRFDVKGPLAKNILEYTNGYREVIPLDFMNNASVEQIQILLDTIVQADGHIEIGGRVRIAKKNDYMAECLQSLLLMIGHGSKRNRRLSCTDTVTVYKKNVATTVTSKVLYRGTVWCPTTATGTFVCRTDNGVPFLTGNSPFTNVSMDLYVPEHMKEEYVIIAGKTMDRQYKEFQKEMDMINKAFCEVMIEGDSEGRQFPFPIPNYSITKDFDWENPNLEPLWKLTGKYGAPYFTNFVNSDLSPEDVRSMCPLHPDEKIQIRFNGSYVTMRIEDVYKNLRFRSDYEGKAFVRLNDKEIPVSGVSQHRAKGFVKIYTDLDPDGICMDLVHLQPVKRVKESKTNFMISPTEVLQAKDLVKGSHYVPYSMTGFEDYQPKDSFVSNDMLWVPIRHTESVEKTVEYSYCIEVKSDDHLFELAPGKLITHNCRLQLDNRELRKRGGGLFGANPLTGSIGVVTINLPLIGYRHKQNKEGFYRELDDLLDLAYKSLLIKRKFIEQKCDEGLYPFSRFYTRDTKLRHGEYYYNHFSTIGIVGGNECALNYLGKNIMDPDGLDFVKEILLYIREKMKVFQEKSGYPFNLEASPAEGVSYRLAKLDVDKHPDIVTAITGCDGLSDPYYTNSSQIPVNATDDIFEICEHQNQLQPLYTGGTVQHLMLGEEITNTQAVKDLIKSVCQNYRIPYVTISPKYSVCANHGYLAGEQNDCPTCGGETEVYARVVGFFTPVRRWNKGKQSEYTLRKDMTPETIIGK